MALVTLGVTQGSRPSQLVPLGQSLVTHTAEECAANSLSPVLHVSPPTVLISMVYNLELMDVEVVQHATDTDHVLWFHDSHEPEVTKRQRVASSSNQHARFKVPKDAKSKLNCQ